MACFFWATFSPFWFRITTTPSPCQCFSLVDFTWARRTETNSRANLRTIRHTCSSLLATLNVLADASMCSNGTLYVLMVFETSRDRPNLHLLWDQATATVIHPFTHGITYKKDLHTHIFFHRPSNGYCEVSAPYQTRGDWRSKQSRGAMDGRGPARCGSRLPHILTSSKLRQRM